jgi:DNA-binding transcriptional regulator YiaG
MLIELRRLYDQHEDRFFLRQYITFENENDDIQDLVNREFVQRELHNIFQREFRTHEGLYKSIDEKYLAPEYNPTEQMFHPSDRGYAKFIRDMSKRDLDLVAATYRDVIVDKVGYIQEMFQREDSGRISVSVVDSGNPVQLQQLDFGNTPMVIVGDQCYSMQLTELNGAQSIKDIEKDIYDKVTEDYQKQLNSIKRNYETRIDRLQSRFERDKNVLFAELLENSKDILNNWEFERHNDHLYLKYKNRIITDKITYNHATYDYPGAPDFQEMYVSGLKVRVKPFIDDSDVIITRGFNVHFTGSRGSGCMGSLSGQPLFVVLRELPETLKIANMDSPNNSEIADYIRSNFLNNNALLEENRRSLEWTA